MPARIRTIVFAICIKTSSIAAAGNSDTRASNAEKRGTIASAIFKGLGIAQSTLIMAMIMLTITFTGPNIIRTVLTADNIGCKKPRISVASGLASGAFSVAPGRFISL